MSELSYVTTTEGYTSVPTEETSEVFYCLHNNKFYKGVVIDSEKYYTTNYLFFNPTEYLFRGRGWYWINIKKQIARDTVQRVIPTGKILLHVIEANLRG